MSDCPSEHFWDKRVCLKSDDFKNLSTWPCSPWCPDSNHLTPIQKCWVFGPQMSDLVLPETRSVFAFCLIKTCPIEMGVTYLGSPSCVVPTHLVRCVRFSLLRQTRLSQKWEFCSFEHRSGFLMSSWSFLCYPHSKITFVGPSCIDFCVFCTFWRILTSEGSKHGFFWKCHFPRVHLV